MEEKQIYKNLELLQQILHRISVPTFVIDQDHMVTHWNMALEKLTGLPATEVMGTRCHWQAFYPSEKPLMADLVVDNAHEDVVAGFYNEKYRKSSLIDSAYEAEDFFPGLGNEGKWIFFTAAPIPDSSGRIIGAVQTLQDITERRQAEKEVRESAQRYKELSITDSLTKLFNSRHFFRQLKHEVERADRYRQPLSLLLLDIDNFKQYNDAYGHLEGDKALTVLADVIRKNLRCSDTAYRYGGEEFTVLLPNTEREDVLIVAERLRESFANSILSPLPETKTHLTVSLGAGQYIPGEQDSAFLNRVDEGMYMAKKDGKNRIFFAC